MKMNRIWAMPNKDTFSIKPIKELLTRIISEVRVSKMLVGGACVIDPFSNGDNQNFSDITNDINPSIDSDYTMDAIEFLKSMEDNCCDVILIDPPYSNRQVSEHYKKAGVKVTGWHTGAGWGATIKNEAKRMLKPGGISICFGWNSMGLGKNRGFEIIEVLLVPHGGSKNDTIVTVERKAK